jgi:hypothetical protein
MQDPELNPAQAEEIVPSSLKQSVNNVCEQQG